MLSKKASQPQQTKNGDVGNSALYSLLVASKKRRCWEEKLDGSDGLDGWIDG
jgi:hypothetical protein